ncbi:MAG: S1C family serine protease [Planctomycetota bacterium]
MDQRDQSDPRQQLLARHLRLRRRILLVWTALMVLLALWALRPLWWPALNPGATRPRMVTPRGELAQMERTAIELFATAKDSVVYITTSARRYDPWTRMALDVPRGSGSGFIWDDSGHIVTNYHVIENASSAEIVLGAGERLPVRLIGVSPDHDLAVLRITEPATALRPLPLGESDELAVGQWVFAIGNPFGLDQTLTTGVVSALGRKIKGTADRPIEDVIQTDAAINPGNSGGPLLDSAGRLIGVNTAIYSPSGASAGIGFAIPVNTVNRVVPQLISSGRYSPPRLGVETDRRFNRQLARQLGIAGAVVLGVETGSVAERIGLRPARLDRRGRVIVGDVITAIDGQAVASESDLPIALDRVRPGEPVTITVWRSGETRELVARFPMR